MSRGKLSVPSVFLTELVYQSFALLDLHDSSIRSQYYLCTRQAVLCMLKYYLDNIKIFCDDHFGIIFNILYCKFYCKGLEIIFNILVNIFYSNKQKIINDSIIKDSFFGFKRRQREKH